MRRKHSQHPPISPFKGGFSAIAIVFACGVAFGDSVGAFEARLKQGFRLLEGGDTQGAVAEFRDLQVEQPESDVVTYSLASAKYKQGLLDAKNEAAQDAITRFTEARTAFDELYASEDPFIRFNAAYNAANCSAQIAKNSIGSGNHEETVQAFEDAIQDYEMLLQQRPDHEGVKTNLNHMRYLLKTLMQNPPPQQEQQSGEGDEDEKQEGEEEGEQEEQQQPAEDEQSGEQKDEQQQDEQQETQENPQDVNSAADENQEEAEPLNRQNIEAILQSLEDQDREEQKKLRRAKEPPRIVNRKWW